MRICVLSDPDPDFDPTPFLVDYDWSLFALSAPVEQMIRDLATGGGFDVFLNLARGYELEHIDPDGPEYLGIDVVRALDGQGVPYTGADPRHYDPSPEEQRAAAAQQGIPFVVGGTAESVEDAVRLAEEMRYPLIAKHPHGRSRLGTPADAIAADRDELKVEAARMLNNFEAARVEEFVPGAEYHILVVENVVDEGRPVAYPPSEMLFLPDQHFRRTDTAWGSDLSPGFRLVSDGHSAAGLRDAACRMFLGLGLTGYALATMRGPGIGLPTMLGIHPNPAIMSPGRDYAPADYIILGDRDGFPGFLNRIFAAAQKRLTKISRSVPTA